MVISNLSLLYPISFVVTRKTYFINASLSLNVIIHLPLNLRPFCYKLVLITSLIMRLISLVQVSKTIWFHIDKPLNFVSGSVRSPSCASTSSAYTFLDKKVFTTQPSFDKLACSSLLFDKFVLLFCLTSMVVKFIRPVSSISLFK